MQPIDNEIIAFQEPTDMGSHNHSYLQAKLIFLLYQWNEYTVFSELSLDISHLDWNQFHLQRKEELKPDICLYPKRSLSRPRDLIRMSEVPVLIIEILSPQQLIADILTKFEIYFALEFGI